MEDAKEVVATETVNEPKRKTRHRGQAGSCFRRGSSFTIIYRAPNGKQKWESGFRTKEAARSRLDEALGEIRKGKYIESTDLLFGEFCDTWMENAKGSLKPTTWVYYRSVLKRWIRPTLGERPICEISRGEVKDFIFSLLRRPKPGVAFIRNIHTILHRIFEDAIERDKISANPARNITGLPKAEDSHRVVPTPEEVRLTFGKLRPTLQALLVTGAITGARRSELVGLKWSDINWTLNIIQIRRSLHRVPKSIIGTNEFRNVERIGNSGLVLTPPKSKKGIRNVEMPPRVVQILSSLKATQSSECEFVFQNELGGPIDPDGLDTVLTKAQDEAEVRHFGLHGLRHLYASLLHKSGATVKLMQERLGHADPLTTLAVYTHLVGSGDEGRAASDSVAGAFDFPSVSLTLAKPVAALPDQESPDQLTSLSFN